MLVFSFAVSLKTVETPASQDIERGNEEDDEYEIVHCMDKYSCYNCISDCFSMIVHFGCLCVVVEIFFLIGTAVLLFISNICCDKLFGKVKKTRYFSGGLKSHKFFNETVPLERPESLQDVDMTERGLIKYDNRIKELKIIDCIQELKFMSRFQLKYDKHVDIILKYAKDNDKFREVQEDQYSCLDIAMYFGHQEIAVKLINLKFPEMILHQGKYKANCLHLAILQNNSDLVRSCINGLEETELKRLLHAEADKKLVRSLYGVTAVKARLPLNIAVLVGNEEIIDLIIKAGAELDEQDSGGYSVLHTIVLMSNIFDERTKDKAKAKEEAEAKAIAMYSLIMSTYSVDWWKKTLESKGKQVDHTAEMEAGYYLLNLKTKKHKLTSLVLAAQIGSKEMLQRIINTEEVYKLTVMKGGSDGVCYYDISDIDAVRFDTGTDDCPSVVEVLVTTENDKSLECLDIPLLDDLLSSKWNNYFIYYVLIATGYILYMGLLTATLFEINMPELLVRNNQSTSSDRITNSPFISPVHWSVFIGSVFILLIGVSSMISSFMTYINRKLQFNIWRDVAISFFCILFSVAVICRFGFYRTGNYLQVPLFGISVVCGWCFSIFFLNGFRPTALFSVMIERLLFRDLLIFAFCYFLISCGFAAALAANMNYRTVPKSFWYSDWKFTLFTLFRTMVGATENDELFEDLPREVYGYNIFLFIIYVVLTAVFLLNMLIASMSSTYTLIAEKQDLFWKRLRSHNIRLFERKMPICLQVLNSNVHSDLTQKSKIRTKEKKLNGDYDVIVKERKMRLFKIKTNKTQ